MSASVKKKTSSKSKSGRAGTSRSRSSRTAAKKTAGQKIRTGHQTDFGKEERILCKENIYRKNLSKRKKFRRESIFCKADLVRDPHQGGRESVCFSHKGEGTCLLIGRGEG